MFGRLLTAMVTPFTSTLQLDTSRLARLIDHLIASGTTALVASGTTGESPTLTNAEKLSLFEECLRLSAGRVPVIAGTGCNDTTETVAFTQEVESLGIHGFLIVAPYYNKPSQEGLYRHFRAVAECTEKPILVYNIPGRTGVNIQVETMVQLAKTENIVGIKESSGDFTQISRMIGETPDDFIVYSGDDKFTLPILALGGDGVISVASHLVGTQMSQMIDAFFSGEIDFAKRLHHQMFPLFEELFKTSNPVLVKAALSILDVPVGGVRLPLVEATSEEKRELRRVLGKIVNLIPLH